MSLHKQSLTNYYNFNVKQQPAEKCAKCGETMKGWAKTKCSVCNRFFCQSHMVPYVGSNKKCPDCFERLQSLKQIDAVPTAFQQANNYYIENKNQPALDLENKIFASIFGPNNLIKFAAENDLSEEKENDFTTDPMQQMPPQIEQETIPQEEPQAEQPTEEQQQKSDQPQEQETNVLEEGVNSLVDMVAKEIIAEIQTNAQTDLTEEQIIALFMQKMQMLKAG